MLLDFRNGQEVRQKKNLFLSKRVKISKIPNLTLKKKYYFFSAEVSL